ncbi:amino acid permease-associated region [Alicyclobacillus hesperidum URH17-3-68]|uniref:Amino acid transporter n=2 Tax=Alicyclobacillus hesperidum TaxID=89784 RepID=A0AA37X4U1_9BACL|nr:amino acid permease-associated region [Alicyclobacillus hesperidum URH17-3-68]GLV13613.1 amino acid transporter [Alicyclobacillus hesperidum]
MNRSISSMEDARLDHLGYRQELSRKLRTRDVLGLAIANVSPTMAVLLLTSGVFSIGGTFAIGADGILAIVVVLISMCLGELGSLFPVAGGMYSLIRFVLPEPLAFIALFNYLIQGVILPASIALGIGQFVENLFPRIQVSDAYIAIIAVAIAVAIALVRVEMGAFVTMAMVAVELLVLGTVTIAALLHPHQALFQVTFHPIALVGQHLVPVTIGMMAASLAPAFNIINGYDATLGFSEELMGGPRTLARTVRIAAMTAAIAIVVPLTSAVISTPDLVVFFRSPSPVIESVQASLGSNFRIVLDIGVCIALFNSMLVYFMYFGRVFYTTGRDQLWWASANRVVSHINRFRSPGWCVVFLALPTAALLFLSQLNWLIIFSGTVTTVVYFFIGLAAIWSRRKFANEAPPYRMPMWPLAPGIVVLFTAFAIATQEIQYLVGELVLAGMAIVFFTASRWWWRKEPRELAQSSVEKQRLEG